jgi:hypothetical protein
MTASRRRWDREPTSCSPDNEQPHQRRRSHRRSHFPPLQGARPASVFALLRAVESLSRECGRYRFDARPNDGHHSDGVVSHSKWRDVKPQVRRIFCRAPSSSGLGHHPLNLEGVRHDLRRKPRSTLVSSGSRGEMRAKEPRVGNTSRDTRRHRTGKHGTSRHSSRSVFNDQAVYGRDARRVTNPTVPSGGL